MHVLVEDVPSSYAFELAVTLYGAAIQDWRSTGPKGSIADEIRLFSFDPLRCLSWYDSPEFDRRLARYLEVDVISYDLERAKRLVLHVITSTVIRQCSKTLLGTSLLDLTLEPAGTLIEALKLRQLRHLPETTISDRTLVHPAVLVHLGHRQFVPPGTSVALFR